jgi:hypothetical protein
MNEIPIGPKKKFPAVYQLSDVLYDTDPLAEVIDDLQFTERLRRLSSHPRRGNSRQVACQ